MLFWKRVLEMLDDEQTVARLTLERARLHARGDEWEWYRHDPRAVCAEPSEDRPIRIADGRPGIRDVLQKRTADERSGSVVVRKHPEPPGLAGKRCSAPSPFPSPVERPQVTTSAPEAAWARTSVSTNSRSGTSSSSRKTTHSADAAAKPSALASAGGAA